MRRERVCEGGEGLSRKRYSAKVLRWGEIWWSVQHLMDEPSADSSFRFYHCCIKDTIKSKDKRTMNPFDLLVPRRVTEYLCGFLNQTDSKMESRPTLN